MRLIHISHDAALWHCMINLLRKCCLTQKGVETRCFETPDCFTSVPHYVMIVSGVRFERRQLPVKNAQITLISMSIPITKD